MRLLRPLLLLALFGCAGVQVRPDSAALRRVWLLHVPTVKSPIEAEFATIELRRMLSESGRFLLVDEPSVAHVIVQATLVIPQRAVTDRIGAYGNGTAPPMAPTASISLVDARSPDDVVWSRTTSAVREQFQSEDATRSLDTDRRTALRLARALSTSLIQAAGPADEVPRTP